ncbi:MAG TPA: heat-inducible transcriptional repressor HrcA [Longimicrobiaceae bacterium]|jgi:heat-inducible transcriptional repressor|nr:heat-inducible transcriptional repressor HrcA [Longimicrobiaceae bacterium]
MAEESLSEREHHVLEAVIRTYVETAEPAGSRTVARRFKLGVSPATVRNTMSDLEEKGYLYHPHTSAGRVPTDAAYRLYVDALMGRPRPPAADWQSIRHELEQGGTGAAIEQVVRRAAQVLGLLTQELGIAIAPRMDEAFLERLELIPISEGKVLLVLALRAAGVRTVYVDVPAVIAPATLAAVARVLNERLGGLSLREIRATLPDRLRDTVAGGEPGAAELLNVFLQSGTDWFAGPETADGDLHLGRASVLAEQPEFSTGERLRALVELTERRDLLTSVMGSRMGAGGLHVTIGVEHGDPALADFTVVTSEYRIAGLKGVIGVIGPTRMPYDRVIALVDGTSALITEFLT